MSDELERSVYLCRERYYHQCICAEKGTKNEGVKREAEVKYDFEQKAYEFPYCCITDKANLSKIC